MRWSSLTFEKTIAPPAAEALAGMASARRARKTVRMLFLRKFLDIGCSFRAISVCVHRCSVPEPCRPMTLTPPIEPRLARSGSWRGRESHPTFSPPWWVENRRRGSAGAVEGQCDSAGGDLAGAVAAAVAGAFELGGDGVQAADGGALPVLKHGRDAGAG